MPVKSRKAEQTEATRAALLKIARRLFTEHGYGDTSIEDVARKARVTKGALYHHFRDKQALFAAVFEAEELRLVEGITVAGMKEGDAWGRLVAGCRAFLEACNDPAIQRIVLIDAPSVLGWERWREIDAQYGLRLVSEGLQAASEAGLIECGPVAPLAHILLGALNEAGMLMAHAGQGSAAKGEVSATVMRLLSGLRRSVRNETSTGGS
jgi:AcrR family transcriptional regulator